MKKVLITGVSGFVGQYLAETLLQTNDIELHGTYHSESGLARLADLQRHLILHHVDLTDRDQVNDLILKAQPDEIYHLAAQTSPRESLKDPLGTFMTNVGGEIELFEAVKQHKPKTRMVVVSTSEVYGLVKSEDLPVDEETQLTPITPYAVSKIASDYLGLQYFLSDKLQVIRVRPFNHTGPRQSATFVVPAFAKQIAEIEKGIKKEPIIQVGNLSAKKDFSDVRDIVRAYMLLMENGQAGEAYNIGSGKSVEIEDILHTLLSFAQIEIRVEQDKSLFRPVDVENIYCDHTKIASATGWKPEISLEKTLRDTLDYFRKIV
jgi:GDP-4-dehydro-6-deoxy-D-mannose reductase